MNHGPAERHYPRPHTGVGKTFIACALGHAACRQGFIVRYYRVSRLLGELSLARADGSYPKLLRSLAHKDLLILDDWGSAPLSQGDCREMLEVIDDRSHRCSTIVASQLPLESWHAIPADPTIADAILDRLVHNTHKILLQGAHAEGDKQPDVKLILKYHRPTSAAPPG